MSPEVYYSRRLHLMAIIEAERAAIAEEVAYALRGMNQYMITSHHVGQTMQVRTALDFMKEKHDANVAELEALNKENEDGGGAAEIRV